MAAANHPLPDLDALNPNELKVLILTQRERLLSKDEQLTSRDNEIGKRPRLAVLRSNIPHYKKRSDV